MTPAEHLAEIELSLSINIHDASQIPWLIARVKKLTRELEKISDINSAGPSRPSFGDWELRLIARKALEDEDT